MEKPFYTTSKASLLCSEKLKFRGVLLIQNQRLLYMDNLESEHPKKGGQLALPKTKVFVDVIKGGGPL